jgi:hypothetical protein
VNPTHNPPLQYPAPKQLPPVAQVQLCASPLLAGGSYTPSAAPRGVVANLAATGGAVALPGGLVLFAAALVVFQVRRALP